MDKGARPIAFLHTLPAKGALPFSGPDTDPVDSGADPVEFDADLRQWGRGAGFFETDLTHADADPAQGAPGAGFFETDPTKGEQALRGLDADLTEGRYPFSKGGELFWQKIAGFARETPVLAH